MVPDSSAVMHVQVDVDRALVVFEAAGWDAARTAVPALAARSAPAGADRAGQQPASLVPGGWRAASPVATSRRSRCGRRRFRDGRSDVIPLRPDLYASDPVYRARVARALSVDPALPVRGALAEAASRRPICIDAGDRRGGRAATSTGTRAGCCVSAVVTRRPTTCLASRRSSRRARARRRPGSPTVRAVYDGAAALQRAALYGAAARVRQTPRPPPVVPDSFQPAVKRVLIANRGEIALRVMRACHEEGLEAVAVYSDADRTSPHVRAADHAVHIGPVACRRELSRHRATARGRRARAARTRSIPATDSSPSARRSPRRSTAAGLMWIGPPPSAIRAMGDKTEARRRMQAAGVPVVPGAVTPVADLKSARLVAEEIGFPLMVKASAGGGGRGMRVVRAPGELRGRARERRRPKRRRRSATRASTSRSTSSGRGTSRSRCSPTTRARSTWASASARSSAGTRSWWRRRRRWPCRAELRRMDGAGRRRGRARRSAIAAPAPASSCSRADGSFYFLEMNTRIQVEHPVTELVYGVDLVREQLRIARGLPDERARHVPASRAAGRSNAASPVRIPRRASCPRPGGSPASARPAGPGVRWDCGRRGRERGDALLRLAAGEADRVGPEPGRRDRAHGARARRAGHRRRGDQPVRSTAA